MGFERKYYARTTQFKEINTFCNHLVHPPLWKKQYGETMTSWILLSPAVSRQKCGCFKLLTYKYHYSMVIIIKYFHLKSNANNNNNKVSLKSFFKQWS